MGESTCLLLLEPPALVSALGLNPESRTTCFSRFLQVPSPWLQPEDTHKCAMFLSLEELTMRVGDRDDAGGLGGMREGFLEEEVLK